MHFLHAIQLFPIHQEMEIVMKEQYITFTNEDNVHEPVDRKNAFITALLCLQNVLLPEENVEEIEISIVSEKETNPDKLCVFNTNLLTISLFKAQTFPTSHQNLLSENDLF